MKSITKQKPVEEIAESLEEFDSVFIVGCGTCTTMAKTGGIEEVNKMQEIVKEMGKTVTGAVVIPTACDEMTEASLEEYKKALQLSGCILVMSCALGAHKLSQVYKTPVIPGVDTNFIGMEDHPGDFHESCIQCGQCVLGWTAGICPLTACHKGLLNGPCGGTNNGKCEVDKEKDCAWTLIYNRLKEQGRLPVMRKYRPPKNYQVNPRPRSTRIS
jgi:ferredoxin